MESHGVDAAVLGAVVNIIVLTFLLTFILILRSPPCLSGEAVIANHFISI